MVGACHHSDQVVSSSVSNEVDELLSIRSHILLDSYSFDKICLGLRFHCLSIKLENPLDITETDHMRLPCLAKKPQSIKQKTLAYIT